MTEDATTLYCYNHPNIATGLRCNNCERPICPKCAVLTPTGYRCKDCVRLHQKTFETAEWYDYPLAFIVAAVLSYLGSLIGLRISFFIIFLAPVAGMIIAEAVRLVVRRRRSRKLTLTSATAAAIGSGIVIIAYLTGSGYFRILPFIYLGIFAFIVTSTVLYRLGGIRIK